MTFVSLFAGIGGFDLGLERAGWTCVGQVEVDQYARRILERHWPDVRRRGDIRLVDDEWAQATWRDVDAIVGGFPCQDVSCAGKGAGVEKGARSGLWREFARLVRCLRPRWIVAENVSALRTRGADLVIGDLEAAGYTVWPCVVGADDLGAPHRRKRVWIIARRVDDAEGKRWAREGLRREGCGPAGPWGADSADGRMGYAHDPRLEGRGVPGRQSAYERTARATSSARRWPARPGEPQHAWEKPRTTESGVGRSVDGLSRRLALKAYGNAVVPQIPELIGRAINSVEAAALTVAEGGE